MLYIHSSCELTLCSPEAVNRSYFSTYVAYIHGRLYGRLSIAEFSRAATRETLRTCCSTRARGWCVTPFRRHVSRFCQPRRDVRRARVGASPGMRLRLTSHRHSPSLAISSPPRFRVFRALLARPCFLFLEVICLSGLRRHRPPTRTVPWEGRCIFIVVAVVLFLSKLVLRLRQHCHIPG